ncbi:hypothetical protein QJS04_geneDACA017991 [Acorus gramineus]|uniref:Rapid ALkalinization Factor n=1 Tax=Acorus gramineus TaxID=55184 RepID=A0AAV9A658_ACOGR|nr:hypothetical protein QJS04_geneDACA017991 [Acorus gramineus]
MVKQKIQFLSFALLIIVVLFVQANLAIMSSFSAHVTTTMTTRCNRSSSSLIRERIEEEEDDDDEWSMESETSRRILQAMKSISKGALEGGKPVCRGTPGEPYVGPNGCIPLPSNKQTRPCTPFYRCKGG